jgi:signal transduction histidine kinase
MKAKLTKLSRRYQASLRKHLHQGPRAGRQSAQRLGRRAVVIGLETLDIARMHEQALAALVSPRDASAVRKRIIKRAKSFFNEAITPIEQTHRAAKKAIVRLGHLNRTLDRRTIDLTASGNNLKKEIALRKHAQESLKKSGQHHTRVLKESHRLQKHLRHLTHRILSAQEEKRTRISRELHDEIAQTLLGINVRLLALKQESVVNAKGLKKEIANTQRLVEKSVKLVARFACDFGIDHET